MFRFLKVALYVVIGLVLAGLAGLWWIGAWNLVFPTNHHDATPPELSADIHPPSLLLFSKTNAFRHRAGIPGAVEAIGAIADARGWKWVHLENGAVFNDEDLDRFTVVAFVNATGNMLSAEQRQSFRKWLTSGGSWLGVHAAGDGSHAGWPWYVEHLIGAEYDAHILGPQFQTATVITSDAGRSVLGDIPEAWQHEEEWYSWKTSPRTQGFTVLATVDETSYTPELNAFGTSRDLRMGDHPVVWTKPVGRGRGLYIAMGHKQDAFASAPMQALLLGSLNYLIDTGK